MPEGATIGACCVDEVWGLCLVLCQAQPYGVSLPPLLMLNFSSNPSLSTASGPCIKWLHAIARFIQHSSLCTLCLHRVLRLFRNLPQLSNTSSRTLPPFCRLLVLQVN
jgi:hypothetical protein